jgi:hypothetical protein
MFYAAICSSLWRSLAVSYRTAAHEYLQRKQSDKIKKYAEKYFLPVTEYIHGFAECDLEDGEGKVAIMGRHLLVHPTTMGYVIDIYACLHACICMCVCVCIYIYIYI